MTRPNAFPRVAVQRTTHDVVQEDDTRNSVYVTLKFMLRICAVVEASLGVDIPLEASDAIDRSGKVPGELVWL